MRPRAGTPGESFEYLGESRCCTPPCCTVQHATLGPHYVSLRHIRVIVICYRLASDLQERRSI